MKLFTEHLEVSAQFHLLLLLLWVFKIRKYLKFAFSLLSIKMTNHVTVCISLLLHLIILATNITIQTILDF